MAETDVTRLDQDVADIKAELRRQGEGLTALREDVAELKGMVRGVMEQMDRRIANLEQTQRWGLGLWAVLVLAVLGLYFKG
jgi:hypothetical protein